MKNPWKTIKYATNNTPNNSKNILHFLVNKVGIKIIDNEMISNIFNDFFSTADKNITEKI